MTFHRALIALLATAGLLVAAPSAAAQVRADFNGDGYADLAAGAPSDSVGGEDFAGAVNVIYGSSRGLRADGDQQFTQNTPGVAAFASEGDRFGASLAAGDLNGDGFADLAVGVPGEDVGGRRNAGIVNVLYGSSDGITVNGNRYFHQGSEGVPGGVEAQDAFGRAVAIADFDGDGLGDLAAGVPREWVGGARVAGAVNVLYGSGSGLSGGGAQLWHQDTPGIRASAGDFDKFGYAVAGADVDGDGDAELMAGVPGERIRGQTGAGAVNVIYGSPSGLREDPDQLWSQGRGDVRGAADRGDSFGRFLATGDFNGDGRGDMAVGAPTEDLPGREQAGAVNVIFGSPGGLSGAGDGLWFQSRRGVPGASERGDRFGSSLAGGDMSRNGIDDLAIGVPGEGIAGRSGAGAVNVLYGSAGGLKRDGAQLWHQRRRGIDGAAERFDRFGDSVVVADFDADGAAELSAGVPAEGVRTRDQGAVNVIYGSTTGLRAEGDQLWHQSVAGIAGAPGPDRFAGALAGGPRGG